MLRDGELVLDLIVELLLELLLRDGVELIPERLVDDAARLLLTALLREF